MATYRKRIVDGKTKWDVTVKRKGAPRQYKTFQTKNAGEIWAREQERDVERGAWISTDYAERTTVAMLLERYAKEVIPTKKSSVSLKEQSNRVKRSDLGKLPLLALSAERIAQHRNSRLKSKALSGGKNGKELNRTVSTQTVRSELALLGRAIEHARREWGLNLPMGNPVRGVKLPAPSKARERRTEEDEYTRIINEAYASRNPRLGAAIEFATETAMRRGELCRLEWKDVDLKRRVARALETKNGDPRDVPLSGRAVALLEKLPRPLRGGRVFALSEGGFSQAFKRIVDRLGIENLRLHDLRHEATSRLAVRLNGDVLALSAITGHKTLGMLKRYTHLKAEDLAERIA